VPRKKIAPAVEAAALEGSDELIAAVDEFRVKHGLSGVVMVFLKEDDRMGFFATVDGVLTTRQHAFFVTAHQGLAELLNVFSPEGVARLEASSLGMPKGTKARRAACEAEEAQEEPKPAAAGSTRIQ
jgi:hypothetical protein